MLSPFVQKQRLLFVTRMTGILYSGQMALFSDVCRSVHTLLGQCQRSAAAAAWIHCQSTRKYSQTSPEPKPVISDHEAINKTFVNRNPRNLEQMALAVKDRGWGTVWPSRQYYHRLVFRRTQHHITAEVYSSDSVDPVLSCSTKEWALKRELGSTRSVAASRAVGEVLAQRCLEAGIKRIVYREVPWMFRSESNQTFWTAMKEGGVVLGEQRRKFI